MFIFNDLFLHTNSFVRPNFQHKLFKSIPSLLDISHKYQRQYLKPLKLSQLQVASETKTAIASKNKSFIESVKSFAKGNWLVIGEVIVILIAKKWPKLGCTGGPLKPEFWISKVGVFLIFFINGIAISLKKDDSDPSGMIGKTNFMIQFYNIGFIPLVTRLLVPFYPNPAFRYFTLEI